MGALSFVFALVKIVIIIAFLVNTTAILTWAERRQSAMIQDRIGPNRAVIYVPRSFMLGLLLGGGVALAAAVAYGMGWFGGTPRPEPMQTAVALAYSQLGVLVTWVLLSAMNGRVRRLGASDALERAVGSVADRRLFFYVGLFAHAGVTLAGTQAGIPLRAAVTAVGPPLLCAALLGGAVWRASKVAKTPKIGLRLLGLLHPLADGLKFVFKEDFIPPRADKMLHWLGPLIALFPALVTFAVVPFGDTICAQFPHDQGWLTALGHARIPAVVERAGTCGEPGISLQIVDLNVGILYMFALAGTGIIGAAIAGWSSDNKFALLGGLRAASQMVSYEVAMGLSLVGAFMVYGSVRLDDMVRWQGNHAWGIFVQPVAFFLFLAASIAEQKRTPFDAPEGESEIVAGYFLEYSGMKFGMFYLGEYMEVVVSSAVLTTIFFGGYNLPFLHRNGITIAFGDTVLYEQRMAHLAVVLIGAAAFFIKTVVVCWLQLFIRWTVPRFRYDQVMRLGWRKLLPAAIINMMLTGVVLLALDRGGSELSSALGLLGDLTQGVIVVLAFGLVIWFVAAMLKPMKHPDLVLSTSAKYAAKQGGVKATPMQA